MEDLRYVPFLPGDNLGAEPDRWEANELNNESLSRLLCSEDEEFLRELLENDALHVLLNSYLQYRRRSYDPLPDAEPGRISLSYSYQDQQLCRRIFMVFYRVCSLYSSSKRVDAVLRAVRERRMDSVANLLDIASLYGYTNRKLCRSMFHAFFMMSPELVSELSDCADSCVTTVGQLGESLTNHCLDGTSSEEVKRTLIRLRDIVESVSSLASVSPEFSQIFWRRTNTKYFSSIGVICRTLCGGLSFGRLAQLVDETVESLVGSLYNFLEGIFLVERVGGRADPMADGENLILAISSAYQEGEGRESYALQKLESTFNITKKISEARSSGYIAIDDIQHRYLMSMLGVPESHQDQLLNANPLVFQMKQALPDHSEEFLQACLQEYKNKADEAILHILEGSLPTRLLNWKDTSQSPAASSRVPSLESESYLQEKEQSLPQKKRVEDESARFLDHKGDLEKDRILMYAERIEYEDEYDDSFDALNEIGYHVMDGEAMETADTKDVSRDAELKKFYAKEGKIYHRPTEGAEEILAIDVSQASAIAMMREAIKAQEVHGLGAGGNKAAFSSTSGFAEASTTKGPQGRSVPQRNKHKKKGATSNHSRKAGSLKKLNKGM